MFESRVSGGRGNDQFFADAGDSGTFDIQDTLLFGGSGNDLFDVGVGSGTIRGGAGHDTAILDFFDFETMTLETIRGGLRISGTQNKLGQAEAWTQDILGVEQFQIGGASETAAGAVARFAG